MSDSLELESLLSIPLFLGFQLSHDKKKLAFYWDKTGRMELYVMDIVTKEIKKVTNGELPKDIKSGYIWGRDNETIFFTMDDSGAEQNDIYSFNIKSKEKVELSINREIQEYVSDSSPDGKSIVINSLRNGQMNLFKMSIDGNEVTQLTGHENPAVGGSFSNNGKLIAYSSNEEGNFTNSDIYIVKEDGSEVERVLQLKVGSREGFADWSPDDDKFAFTTDIDGFSRPGIFDMETKEVRLLGDRALNEIAIGFDSKGEKLFCLQNSDASIYPTMYDLKSGDRKTFNFPKGIAAGGEITSDDKILLTLNQPSKPSEVILFDTDNETYEILLKSDLSGLNQELFVDSDYVKYPSSNDAKIPAMIFKPKNYKSDEKYPGIIFPHGGPTAQYFNAFMPMAQYYANKGYVVLYPNVRGSTGYGVDFRDACIKDWGGKDLDDWVNAREYLIKNYSVDPDRVAITGGSYGGYATLISVTKKPELWKVGAAIVPVSHIWNLYEGDMPHFKYYLRQQMGDPVKDRELWEERSPLNFASNVTAKLLLVHGETDPRCPVAESRNFVKALNEAGKIQGEDFEYIEIPDQGHGMYTDQVSRIRDAKLISSYIMKHL